MTASEKLQAVLAACAARALLPDEGRDRSPSVVGGVVMRLSPSQVASFDPETEGGCNRRWWYAKVARRREPSSPAQELGTKIHARVEAYLKTGDAAELSCEASKAVRRLLPPPRHPDVHPEIAFEGDTLFVGGVPFHLRIDVLDLRDRHLGPAEEDVHEPGVVAADDLKTAGDMSRVKPPSVVARQVQMVEYAEVARIVADPSRGVRVSHNYTHTRRPWCVERSTAVLSLQEVADRHGRVISLVDEMKLVARATRPEDVTPAYASCNCFGGCPHATVCPRDPRMVVRSVFNRRGPASPPTSEAIVSLIERMRKKAAEAAAAKQPGATTQAATTTTTTAAALPTAEAVAEEKMKLVAEEAAARVAPPDAPTPSAVADARPVPPAPAPGGGCEAAQRELTVDEVAERKAACARCGAGVKVKPQKLGDGKYHALLPAHAAPAAATPPAATLVVPAPVAAALPVVASASGGLELYLDCVPDATPSARLGSYAYELARLLAAEFKAADVRCAPKDSPLGFGGWRGALAAAARAQPPAPGAYLVSSTSELEMVVFEAVAPTARRVVRGIR